MFLASHECGHVSKWRTQAVNPGEHITCGTCGAPTRIKEVFGPWRVRCHDCNRVNGHATLRTTVVQTAIKHAQEWTTHHVWIWQYGNVASRRIVTADGTTPKGTTVPAVPVGVQPPLFTDAPF